jgi:hypothetical protein
MGIAQSLPEDFTDEQFMEALIRYLAPDATYVNVERRR